MHNHCSCCWRLWWWAENASGGCSTASVSSVMMISFGVWEQNNGDFIDLKLAHSLHSFSAFLFHRFFSQRVSDLSLLTQAPSSLSTLCTCALSPFPVSLRLTLTPPPPCLCQSINPQPGADEGIRDQVSEAGRLNDSFHSRHSGIVDFSSPAGTDSRRRRRREEIGLLFVSFLFTLVYLPLTKLSVRSYQLLSVYLIPLLAVFL